MRKITLLAFMLIWSIPQCLCLASFIVINNSRRFLVVSFTGEANAICRIVKLALLNNCARKAI